MADQSQTYLSARDLIAQARLAVIKVGSALITQAEEFTMGGLAADIHEQVFETVLVSSGAIAAGQDIVPSLSPETIEARHALSAIGQATLIKRWQSAFEAHGLVAAQVLLTPDVTDERSRYLNARSAFRALLSNKVVPIVNENDAVTTREFRYGDNDHLAAKTAGLVDANLLIILSDIDGLYTANPELDPSAMHIPFVPYGEATKYTSMAGDSASATGTGGMKAKLAAARIAIDWGVTTIIASGRRSNPIRDLMSGEATCTVFEAGEKLPARKRWLSGVHGRAAGISIDQGAVRALKGGASLLAVGITDAPEPFVKGDVIEIRHDSSVIGFGLAACDFTIAKTAAREIVIHRDNLILTMENDDEH